MDYPLFFFAFGYLEKNTRIFFGIQNFFEFPQFLNFLKKKRGLKTKKKGTGFKKKGTEIAKKGTGRGLRSKKKGLNITYLCGLSINSPLFAKKTSSVRKSMNKL